MSETEDFLKSSNRAEELLGAGKKLFLSLDSYTPADQYGEKAGQFAADKRRLKEYLSEVEKSIKEGEIVYLEDWQRLTKLTQTFTFRLRGEFNDLTQYDFYNPPALKSKRDEVVRAMVEESNEAISEERACELLFSLYV